MQPIPPPLPPPPMTAQPTPPAMPPPPPMTAPTPMTAPRSFPGPLDYDTSNQLMLDMTFRGRVKVACMHFAAYVNGEPASTPAHNTRFRWAQECYQNPDSKAVAVQPATVMDPNVQAQGDSIGDTQLQTAVETAIQNFL